MGTLTIVSTEGTAFEDREEAGGLLGDHLSALSLRDPVVLGIPRGGLVVARALARRLNAPLDAVCALKLGFPGNREFAVGAVAQDDTLLLDSSFVERLGIGRFMEEEQARGLAELERREKLMRSLRSPVDLSGRAVIVTDDGTATGSTARAAFRAVRKKGPRTLVGALPVGPEGVIEKLSEETDVMICLRCPPDFLAVSQFYRHFPQVGEEELHRLLEP